MKVRCIEASAEENLTVGKVYEVVEEDDSIPPGRLDFFVVNDIGVKERYISELFCPLDTCLNARKE
jgi:hypothetical protein